MTCSKVPKNNKPAISATNKTLADILGEMRNRADTVINGRAITERNFVPQEMVEDWADRIEATFRNCDVGSPEEQSKRFEKFCESHPYKDGVGCRCNNCELDSSNCEFAWAQMPFKEEK